MNYLTQYLIRHRHQHLQKLQPLWSNYGSIDKYQLNQQAVVIKSISAPDSKAHPRGWHTDIGHQRKLASYQVEKSWYQYHQGKQAIPYVMPELIDFIAGAHEDEFSLVLSDLDDMGYSLRSASGNIAQLKPMIVWLAKLHGYYLCSSISERPNINIWAQGNYWHLETRPEEFRSMAACPLKQHAQQISQKLTSCQYQTIIHGDAKIANFCLKRDLSQAVAVDFQYIGFGVGVTDLVYLLGSSLDGSQLAEHASTLTEFYFEQLAASLKSSSINFIELRQQWRSLIPFAFADFERFLAGWAPTHSKRNSFTDDMVQQAITELQHS